MAVSGDNLSTVEYYAENSGYRCGYCKSPNTNYSQGMWAHGLTVQDYQDLIDRGWRRSGCYCYKPTLHRTCCPMYTIKCSVLDFKLSKSQKKKLKRFHNFLAHGKLKSAGVGDDASESASDLDSGDDLNSAFFVNDIPDLKEKAERAQLNTQSTIVKSVDASFSESLSKDDKKCDSTKNSDKFTTKSTSDSAPETTNNIELKKQTEEKLLKSHLKKCTRPGEGMDPNRPLCKKAKFLRKERKEKKLSQLSPEEAGSLNVKIVPTTKLLEDFIHEALPESPAHRLEIKLMLVSSPEMIQTLKTSWELFAKYQMAVHNETLSECDMSTYLEFLVDSPLKPWKPQDGPPQGYGSFHQQYWLDDRLIAVGVIDILPNCVSSVYFFYDPEFHFLVLGTYGSLREIEFCRSLQHVSPDLSYYYMGFYIHSCPKMRYKGSYTPSFLLCPEVYTWHPIEKCLPLLEKKKYCRFNEDPNAKDRDKVHQIDDVTVLFHNKVMHYQVYRSLKQSSSRDEEVTNYANVVGTQLAKRMLLMLA